MEECSGSDLCHGRNDCLRSVRISSVGSTGPAPVARTNAVREEGDTPLTSNRGFKVWLRLSWRPYKGGAEGEPSGSVKQHRVFGEELCTSHLMTSSYII